jgi:4-amino-4-deoxy-L-arabinose transferase-like glycosyltransferase
MWESSPHQNSTMLNPVSWLQTQHHRWIASILLAGFTVRLIIAIFLPIGFDEAYYYVYTLHPSWSYFDHPFLVFFTTGFGTWLTGAVNPFTVRIGALLVFTGALIFLYKTAERLFDRQVALITLGLASLMPILTVAFGTLTQPDAPQIFFWMATLWLAAIEFFPSTPYKPTYRVALIGLLVGLTCLAKYHGFLLGTCLIGFCLSSPSHRKVLTSPWVLLASLVFALTISPILYWNSENQWASIVFQSRRAVPNASYNWETFFLTFLVHMVYVFPSIGFPLIWSIGQNLRSQFKSSDPVKDPKKSQKLLVLWLSAPIIIAFAIIAGYQQVLPSWPMAGYMTASMLLADRAQSWLMHHPRRFWNWLIITTVLIHLLFAIALSHLTLGTAQKPSNNAIGGGFLTFEADNSVQLIDVSQLQRALKSSPEIMAAIDRADFIFINRYFPSGQLAMALHSVTKKPLTCFDPDLRGFAYWSTAQEWVGKNAVYIGSETFGVNEDITKPKSDESKRSSITPFYESFENYFQEIKKVATIPLIRGGVVTQTWQVYEAAKMIKPYPRPYGLDVGR